MSTEQQRPGKESLKDYRGPEPSRADELPLTPPVADHDELPPVREEPRPAPVETKKPEPEKVEPKIAPFDARRNEIAERFSKQRLEETEPTDLDFRKPENVYGKLAARDPGKDDETKAPETGPSDSEPYTLTIHGQTLTKNLAELASLADMSEDEVKADPRRAIRYAQKELTADTLLQEAKNLARRGKPPRAAPPGTRPGPEAPDQGQEEFGEDDAPDQQPASRETSAEDDAAKLIEDIQIGDPKEVAPKLARYFDKVARERISEQEDTRRRQSELNSNVSAVSEFLQDHPDLEGKRTVANAISAALDTEYASDLRTILINEGETPQEADRILNVATRDDLRNAHLHRRLNGHPQARKIDKAMIESVWGKVQSDFGIPGQAPPTQSQGLSREQRKQTLPPQPRRASMPPAASAQAPDETVSRREAVAAMAGRTGRKVSGLSR